ncbi:MAG: MarR family transcriptional regulator [Syntrophaceae bacterium]
MKKKNDLIPDIIDNLRRVFQVVNAQSKRAELATGITGPQLWTIKTIAETGPIRISDLARKIYLHPATLVGIIDRLEARGIVTRTRSRVDRRVVLVDLTNAGRVLVAKSPQVAQGLLVSGLETLPVGDLETLASGLKQLVTLLHAQKLPPQLILSPEINIPRRKIGKSSRDQNERKEANHV